MDGRSVGIALAQRLPQSLLNSLLLTFPRLYRTSLVSYESYITNPRDGFVDRLLDETRHVAGDIIECGAARCGTSCLLGVYLKKNQIQKRVFALDTFGEGFDESELMHERAAGLTRASMTAFTFTSFSYVTRKIQVLGLENHVIPVRGWFRETLSSVPGPFSLAIVDCDLGRSTQECLEYVWPRLSNGGLILVDDYWSLNSRGVKRAVDEFTKNLECRILAIERQVGSSESKGDHRPSGGDSKRGKGAPILSIQKAPKNQAAVVNPGGFH